METTEQEIQQNVQVTEEQKDTTQTKVKEKIGLDAMLNITPQRLQELITNPGYRARFFDKTDIVFGTQAQSHLEKAREQLENIKPPLSPESVKNAYALFDQLNTDLAGGEENKTAPLDNLNNAFNQLETPSTNEVLTELKNDIKGAYRFKIITAASYYDDKTKGERQKDFLQLISKNSKNIKNPQECYEKLLNEMRSEVNQDVNLCINLEADKTAQNNDLVSIILTKKQLEYLGPEVTLATIKQAFESAGKVEQFNEFKEKFDAIGKLETDLNKLINEHKNNLDDLVKAIHNNENFKTLGMENGTQLVINQVLAMPPMIAVDGKQIENPVRVKLLQELPKQPLGEFIGKQIDRYDQQEKGKTQPKEPISAKALIEGMRNNKNYVRLDSATDSSAAEILAAKIKHFEDEKIKKELFGVLYAEVDRKIDRRFQDNKDTLDPKTVISAIREDRNCIVLDQQIINDKIYAKITSLPKDQRDKQQPLIDELNQQTGNNYTLPKSGLDVFKEKAGNWLKNVGSTIGSALKGLGSTIGSAFKSIGSMIGSLTSSKAKPQNVEEVKDLPQQPRLTSDWSPHKGSELPPEQARLFERGPGQKIRTNEEVLLNLKQEADYLLKNTTNDKSSVATARIEKVLESFNTFFAKISNDQSKGNISHQEFSDLFNKTMKTTFELENKKKSCEPSFKSEAVENKDTTLSHTPERVSRPPNKPLPPLPTQIKTTPEDTKNTPRPL